MKPTDDDGEVPDSTDELVAQIVPLRRREDDTDRGDQPHKDSQAAAGDTDDWSVFDPPEDLKLAERAEPDQHSEPDPGDYSGDDLEPPWTSPPRAPHRLLAFAGVALAVLAIAALAVLTLKGHAGASPHQPATPTPPVGLTSASRPLAVHQGGSAATQRPRPATRPNHRKPAKRKSSTRTLPHTATSGAPNGEEVSAGRGSVEPSPTPARSEPSPTGTSPTQNAGNEFGIER